MTIALLNTTPIVGTLVERLAQKRGDTLILGAPADGRQADVAVVDESVSDQYSVRTAKVLGRYTLYIGSRFEEAPVGYNAVLSKPFLPDDLAAVLDEAELTVSGAVERSDIFDADEAASSWAEESVVAAERSVFDHADIDELKQLLDAVEEDEGGDEQYTESLEQQIEAALQQLDERAWEQPVEEVLYDVNGEPVNSSGDAFEDIDLHARGLEALQDLIAILSDESVARALKSLGVRIDISFGERV